MSQQEHAAAAKKAKAREASKKKAQEDGWRGFVNVELTADQKPLCKALLSDVERLAENVYGMVEDGYKLSLTWDDVRECYNLSLTCKARGNPNNGLTLTGRGGSIPAAMASFWYKHDAILMGAWGNGASSSGGGWEADDVG